MTVLLHTVMLMSSIFLGTKLRDSLRIELNGLKMNQLFGISRLILRWCLMLMLNTASATRSWEEDTRNKSCLFFLYVTTHQKGENEFPIYIIFMLNDWKERHPIVVGIPHRVMRSRKKKHLSVFYHKTRECGAKGAVRIGYESTDTNLADTCTKILTGSNKRQKIQHILYWLNCRSWWIKNIWYKFHDVAWLIGTDLLPWNG